MMKHWMCRGSSTPTSQYIQGLGTQCQSSNVHIPGSVYPVSKIMGQMDIKTQYKRQGDFPGQQSTKEIGRSTKQMGIIIPEDTPSAAFLVPSQYKPPT